MSCIIFDIETLSQDPAVILANAPIWDIEEAKTRVPKSYKKPEAINGWLSDDEAGYTKNLLEKAALNPETATVAVAGFAKRVIEGGNRIVVVQYSAENYSEKEILLAVLDEISPESGRIPDVIGFNLLGFDIPFFLKRCWINDLEVPKNVFNPLSRYPVSDKFVDMMKVWQAGNYKAPFTSLNNAMKTVGLPGKPDGSEFSKMWAEDKAKALEYNRNELLSSVQLYRKMGIDL